jgi:LysR family transcriptional regulator, regulator for bpeEF and oprC
MRSIKTDRLRAISFFVSTAESGSFTAAAHRWGVTPAAISKSISRLEMHLGARLLNRTTRSVRLTPDGISYHERCRHILRELEDAELALTKGLSVPRGTLCVELPVAFGRLVIVPALSAFAKRYSELRLEIRLSDHFANLVEEGLDAVVRIGELKDSRLVARPLTTVRYVSVASPGYLRRRGIPRHPADLERHNCINFVYPETGREFDWRFSQNGICFSRQVAGNVALNHSEARLDAAIAGLGIIQTFDFLAAPAVKMGKLRPILTDYIADGPTISVIYPQNRHLSPRVRAFVDFMIDLIPSNPAWRRPFRQTPERTS